MASQCILFTHICLLFLDQLERKKDLILDLTRSRLIKYVHNKRIAVYTFKE